jgi:hypothetical protein
VPQEAASRRLDEICRYGRDRWGMRMHQVDRFREDFFR